MYKKASIKIIVILVTAAILTVPSSMLQISHAQSTKALQDVLAIHNRERAEVRNQPLTWSNTLANQAQGYANQLASQGYVCNAQQCDTLPHGAANENLAWGGVGFPIAQMVEGSQYAWVSEKPGYNAQTNTCTPVPPLRSCGHYTAMIWGGTTSIGCGTSTGAQIEVLVCRYDPPGNMAGQTPISQGAAQAVGEEESTFAPPPQEGVGDGGGGDTSGDGGGGDSSGDGGGGDSSGDGGGGDSSGDGGGDAN
jgi:uncharacterized membrane protein YgcG